MLKICIKFLALFAVLCGIAYLGINALLDPVSDEVTHILIEKLSTPNLLFSEPSFRNARISSYNAITLDGFGLTAALASNDASKKATKARVSIEELTVEAETITQGLFIISLKGFSIAARHLSDDGSDEGKEASEVFHGGCLTLPLKLNVMNYTEAASQLRLLVSEMKKLFGEGETTVPVKLTAEEILSIGDKAFTASLWIEKRGNRYRLIANKDDLGFISQTILSKTQTATPADMEIVANNPLKAQQLFRIRSNASNTAQSAHERDPKIPEDAYRHVLWSYLLTKEYGADFAKAVTDAHEFTVDPEEKNNPNAEGYHRQDFNNNEIGRKYAALGYKEYDIPTLVMTDPKVIR
jgi:hypothetical protein